jgi:hypothetical protein
MVEIKQLDFKILFLKEKIANFFYHAYLNASLFLFLSLKSASFANWNIDYKNDKVFFLKLNVITNPKQINNKVDKNNEQSKILQNVSNLNLIGIHSKWTVFLRKVDLILQ